MYFIYHRSETRFGEYSGSCVFDLVARMCLQGRCIVFQNLQQQEFAVTDRFPSDVDTLCAPVVLSSASCLEMCVCVCVWAGLRLELSPARATESNWSPTGGI